MTNKKPKTAFTFLELSIVLTLITTIIAVVASIGSGMVSTARLESARSLTASSPVMDTPGLVFWVESTLKNSFNLAQEVNGSIISNWYDQNPQNDAKNDLTAGSGREPLYISSGINGLPALSF